MRILLVSPGGEDDFLSGSLDDVAWLQADAFFAPLSIATVAALTPTAYDVTLHDEALRGSVIPLFARQDWDVVGVTLQATSLARVQAIARAFRLMGCSGLLVVGGIGTSYMLPKLRDLVDVAFFGEAEDTWPQFLRDFEAGNVASVYQRASKPNLTNQPVPRWDLIGDDIPRYSAASIQTTRGCHHDCSFCDVIYTFGRTPRMKTIAQVMLELEQLQRLGVRMVYFADDNFCTDRRQTKELLRHIEAYNNQLDEPLGFITQIDITVAKDRELLELLADCNFNELQIGIESSAPDSLKDLNKTANSTVDLVESIRVIQAHGLLVMGHLIIGADSDDIGAFQRTLDFVEEANLVHSLCHPLAAPPGTRLWYRLKREGRLVEPGGKEGRGNEVGTAIDSLTNIVPAQMSRVELLEGLADYWERAHNIEEHRRRVHRFLDGIERRPKVARPHPRFFWEHRRLMAGMVTHHLFGVEAEHRRVFFDLVGRAGREIPELFPRVVFAHASFVMDRARAASTARLAREQAAWERAHPELIVTLPRATPLPLALRRQARKVFEPAYYRVRRDVGDRETLYRTVIDAMVDYTDRFGQELDVIDDVQRQHITQCCERTIAGLEIPSDQTPDDLPEDRLPRGFIREILDGLDHALRTRAGLSE